MDNRNQHKRFLESLVLNEKEKGMERLCWPARRCPIFDEIVARTVTECG